MKRLLLILICFIISATLFADVTSASLSAFVNVTPDDFFVMGISNEKPDINDLSIESKAITLAKGRNDSGNLYAYRDVYLYYYFVGSNTMSISVTCSYPLKRDETSDPIQFYIAFGDKPESEWDGGEFKTAEPTSGSVVISSNTAGGHQNVAKANTKSGSTGQKVLARGIWPIKIYTGSIQGLTIGSNEKYTANIYLEIKSNS